MIFSSPKWILQPQIYEKLVYWFIIGKFGLLFFDFFIIVVLENKISSQRQKEKFLPWKLWVPSLYKANSVSFSRYLWVAISNSSTSHLEKLLIDVCSWKNFFASSSTWVIGIINPNTSFLRRQSRNIWWMIVVLYFSKIFFFLN